ncbi:hypothetical protein E6Q11_04295 [Candidatus Dojkabacteria bacterium]|uniref:Uncharacterized protein n=1 Tax=Candidatus Dojkabacteria bacterium TaxID=2099670 RepID=A0A5C7J6P5_9BACT|nr:MAG: hypothetical protein E6Q11_04295 [Candidatus Dojkabacteria bacterium]
MRNKHYKVETKDGEDWYYFGEHQLSPLEKDWDTLEVGDELVDGDGLTITEMYDKVRKEVEETFVRAFPIKTFPTCSSQMIVDTRGSILYSASYGMYNWSSLASLGYSTYCPQSHVLLFIDTTLRSLIMCL